MPFPTKRQWLSYPRIEQFDVAHNITTWNVRFPYAAEAGDTIIIVGQWGSGSDIVSAIADDQSGSLAGGQWVKDKIQSQATDAQTGGIFRRSNVPAGTREITFTLSSAACVVQFSGMIVNNLATSNPVAASASGTPTGTAIAAGNMTSTEGDLFVVTYAACTSGAAVPLLCTFAPQPSYELWAADSVSYGCAMYGPQLTAGTFNPTLNPSKSWTRSLALAVAYRTANVGGRPKSTVELRSVQIVNFNTVNGDPGTTIGPFSVPMMNGLNTICMAFDDGSGIFNTNPKANTATVPPNVFDGTTVIDGGGDPTKHHIGFVYKVDAALSVDMTMTLTVTSSPQEHANGFVVFIFGLANAAFDTFQSGSGNLAAQSGTQNNVLASDLATQAADELIILYQQEEHQTPTSIAATNGTFNRCFEDVGIYEFSDGGHDSGWGIQQAGAPGNYNYNVTFSNYEGAFNVAEWSAQAIAFKTKGAGVPRGNLPPNARGA